jgi:hypothetical protein
LTSFYIQGNIPHACFFRPDSADLLYSSPDSAVIPNDNRRTRVRRFCGYRSASEASAASFCDRPQDGAASPAQALVTGFRIDSGGTNRSCQCSARAAFGHATLVRWAPLPQIPQEHAATNGRRKSFRMRTYTKMGRGVPPCFASSPLRFSSASSPNAIMASFGVAVASTGKAFGKGRRHGQS